MERERESVTERFGGFTPTKKLKEDAEDGADAGGDADAGDGENLDLVDGDGGDIGGLDVSFKVNTIESQSQHN